MSFKKLSRSNSIAQKVLKNRRKTRLYDSPTFNLIRQRPKKLSLPYLREKLKSKKLDEKWLKTPFLSRLWA